MKSSIMAKFFFFLLVLVAIILLGRDVVVNRLNLILTDYLVRNLPFVIFLLFVSVEHILSPAGITLPRLSSYFLLLDGLMLMMPLSYDRPYPAFLFPFFLAICYLGFMTAEHFSPAISGFGAFPPLAVPVFMTAFYYFRYKGAFSAEYSFFVNSAFLLMALAGVEILTISGLPEAGNGLSAASSGALILLYAHIYSNRSIGRRAPSSVARKNAGKKTSDPGPASVPAKGELKDEQYRMEALFTRVEKYMKEKEPYLDEHLTLADMASAMYTNKASLSKAINSLSGKNYCQYVNKYRVDYAVSLMKKDKRLKVIEIAMMSGFHSLASFNMAFRLFKGDTPSEFMRTLYLTDLS